MDRVYQYAVKDFANAVFQNRMFITASLVQLGKHYFNPELKP